jgi:hypothetical protein
MQELHMTGAFSPVKTDKRNGDESEGRFYGGCWMRLNVGSSLGMKLEMDCVSRRKLLSSLMGLW